jgi:hypothetical protein
MMGLVVWHRLGGYGLGLVGAALVVGVFGSSALAQSDLLPTDVIEQSKNLSLGEMVERGQEELSKMGAVVDQTQGLAESIREEEKDLDKLGCVNKKLSTMKGFVKVGEQSQKKLEKARKDNNKETARQQFSWIVLAGSKVDELGLQAQTCAGDAVRYSGDTEVVAEIDENIAKLDPTSLVYQNGDLFLIPKATPYQ